MESFVEEQAPVVDRKRSGASAERRKKPGPPIPPSDEWRPRYLDLIRQHGNYHKTAEAVGISPRTALRERERDPDFDAACLEARQVFADQCENDLVASSIRSDNPVGLIVRLKALRPAEYIEKQATLNLSANLNELPVQDAVELLKRMLGATTPTTQRMLSPAQDAHAIPPHVADTSEQ